jgi:hypothetical protein
MMLPQIRVQLLPSPVAAAAPCGGGSSSSEHYDFPALLYHLHFELVRVCHYAEAADYPPLFLLLARDSVYFETDYSSIEHATTQLESDTGRLAGSKHDITKRRDLH